jgi:hypothetical protein
MGVSPVKRKNFFADCHRCATEDEYCKTRKPEGFPSVRTIQISHACSPVATKGAHSLAHFWEGIEMVESAALLEQWPHCRRADIKDSIAKGPLVYRILAVADTLEALEKEESLLRANMQACRCSLKEAANTEWHEQKRVVLLQLRSLQFELDRILTLKARARQSLPEMEIITERDLAQTKFVAPPSSKSNPLTRLIILVTANFRRRDCA